MRLFVAVNPPEQLRLDLATRLDTVHSRLRIAWTRPAAWHLTLMFLAANAPRPAPLVGGGIGGLLITVVCMVLVRDQVRRGALATMNFEPVLWVEPQWANITLFLVLLVAGAVAVVWMVRALVMAGRSGTGDGTT